MAIVAKNIIIGEQAVESPVASGEKSISEWNNVVKRPEFQPVQTVPLLKKKKFEAPVIQETVSENPTEQHIVKQEDGVLVTHYNKKSSYMVDMVGIELE